MVSRWEVVCAGALCALGALGMSTVACSSPGGASPPGTSAGSFPASAYVTAVGDAKRATIEVRTAPQPPVTGLNEAELSITDAETGEPLDDLDLAVVPWMPAMGHGTSVVPGVSAVGNGRYLVTNLSFFMPGTWELRTTITGKVSDHAVLSFQVP
jgi:hypothetical protein